MIIPTPKERFLADKGAVSRHLAVIDTPDVQRALETALAQYVQELGDVDAPSTLRNYERLQGAKRFMRLYLTLGDPSPEPPKRLSPDHLVQGAETYVPAKKDKP